MWIYGNQIVELKKAGFFNEAIKSGHIKSHIDNAIYITTTWPHWYEQMSSHIQ